LRAKESKE
jgi:hypothetical protein